MADKHSSLATLLETGGRYSDDELPASSEHSRDERLLGGDQIGLLHLGQLLPRLRLQLDIGPELSDDDIMISLASITARGDIRARWLTAFSSPLGHWLVLRGTDLNTSLNLVLAMLPPARS